MQCCFFLIYFIAYMAIITYAPTEKIDSWTTIAHFTIALVTPSGNLLRSLLLTFNEFSLLCHGDERASYAGDITVYGGPILYLLVQSLLLLGFLVYYDSGYRPAFLSRKVRTQVIQILLPKRPRPYHIADFYYSSGWRALSACHYWVALCNASTTAVYYPPLKDHTCLLYFTGPVSRRRGERIR